MPRLLPAVLLSLSLCGCGPAPGDTGSDPDVDDGDDSWDAPQCDEIRIHVDGPEEPVVGDTWTVLLYCDRTLLTGATVLRFDPPEFAQVDANKATFLYAGVATMTMQVGGYRADQGVEVGEAPVDELAIR